jgi:hypothetical protein
LIEFHWCQAEVIKTRDDFHYFPLLLGRRGWPLSISRILFSHLHPFARQL